ncbi:MAG TPA: phosphate acyltransferase PlsX [Flavobacteriales bacterium]|nr:phosphate acyltransferase PlsX [Flavobacteriales bacterium]HAW21143.1 phosphate acyltransferase PlsX [Flavobacteriales bacterium]
MKVGLDVSGGDFAPDANVLGAILAQKELGERAKICLIGNKDQIIPILEREGLPNDYFEIVHTEEAIEMSEHPTKAFLKKPNSTIGLGFKMLSDGSLQAFSSTGNSGAMLVGAMYSIRTIPGVIRPSITSALPVLNGGVSLILDVGINADCKPDVLYQFGILGSIMAEHIYNIDNPKVGLLNIGEEDEKGNLLSQAAHEMMKESKDFNFIGNIEGRDLFSGKADVIVCDGFTGNIVLKQAEALYTLIKKRSIEDSYFERFNYEIYGGTPVLGVNGNVIIGHGISNQYAVKNMILLSVDTAEANLADRIRKVFT